MIIATEKEKGTAVTEICDELGRSITICSSRSESSYLSPRQLLQGALAGCMSMTLRSLLRSNGIEYEDVIVTVEMEQAETSTCFAYDIKVISSADKDTIDRYTKQAAASCFIKELLSGDISFRRDENMIAAADTGCCG